MSRSWRRTRTPLQALAPGTARRAALDDALAEMDARPRDAVLELEGALRAHARPRARAHRGPGPHGRRHRASPPPGRRAGGNARGAHRGDAASRRRERKRPRLGQRREPRRPRSTRRRTTTTTPGTSRTSCSRTELTGTDPGAVRRFRFRHPTASGKTIAAAGFVEAARHLGVLILTHRRLLVSQFKRDLTTEGYGDRFTDALMAGTAAPTEQPAHDPDLRLVRATRLRARPQRLPPRDLRRGAHGARREDERGDPCFPGAALHRDDGDRAADREAGLGRLPGVRRRPPARRRGATRAHRSASVPPRPAGGGDQLGSDRRRRLRGARAGRSARPPGAEPGGREPLPGALRLDARDRLRRRRGARLQPRAGVPRGGAQGRGRLGPHAARAPRRDARRLRARRDQRAHQRDAPRRGLELAARDGVHAPRADGVAPRLPAANRADHAHPPAEGSRRRRRLRPEGRDALGARRVAPRAARLRLLPRGRPRHSRTAASPAASRAAEALAGAVARPGHARCRATARRHPARVAAHRPEVPGRRRAALLGDDRRTPDPIRPARRVREEVRRGPRDEGRARAVPRRPARRRTPTAVSA